jgi:hypothetical protein
MSETRPTCPERLHMLRQAIAQLVLADDEYVVAKPEEETRRREWRAVTLNEVRRALQYEISLMEPTETDYAYMKDVDTRLG